MPPSANPFPSCGNHPLPPPCLMDVPPPPPSFAPSSISPIRLHFFRPFRANNPPNSPSPPSSSPPHLHPIVLAQYLPPSLPLGLSPPNPIDHLVFPSTPPPFFVACHFSEPSNWHGRQIEEEEEEEEEDEWPTKALSGPWRGGVGLMVEGRGRRRGKGKQARKMDRQAGMGDGGGEPNARMDHHPFLPPSPTTNGPSPLPPPRIHPLPTPGQSIAKFGAHNSLHPPLPLPFHLASPLFLPFVRRGFDPGIPPPPPPPSSTHQPSYPPFPFPIFSQMQQIPQANAPPAQFSLAPPAPSSSLYGPLPPPPPPPPYGQQLQSSTFDSSASFAQYQFHLYQGISAELQNNAPPATTGLPPPPIQFQAKENTNGGRTGPERRSKVRDKSAGGDGKGGPNENGGRGTAGERAKEENGHARATAQAPNASSSNGCPPQNHHFLYGPPPPPPAFGAFDPAGMGGPQEYSLGWNGTLSQSYSQISPVPGPMGAGACLGLDDVGGLGLYGPNGLMVLPGQLQYELEPTGYGVWAPGGGGGGGYYLGGTTDQQHAKNMLTADGHYLGGTSTDADRYSGNSAQPPTSFYGPLQGIQASIDGSAFPGVSTLPPPPSQLASADQLYGPQNGFPPLAPHESANGLTTLGQTNPSQSQPFYPLEQPKMFGEQSTGQLGSEIVQIQSTSRQSGGVGPTNSGFAKRSAAKAQMKGSIPLGRPSTSAGQSLAERGGSPQQEKANAQRKSRSRSVVKDSDDDKSMEEREAERRNANNTRERIRVKDINAAFRELARLCCQHMPNVEERSLTKLGTLLKAVELIPLLEKKVEEKNRNIVDPRRECLKQRMEATSGQAPPPNPMIAVPFPPLPSSSSLLAIGPSSIGLQSALGGPQANNQFE